MKKLTTNEIAQREGCSLRHARRLRAADDERCYILPPQRRKGGDVSAQPRTLFDQRLFEQIRRLRLANDSREARYVLRADVAATVQRIEVRAREYLATVPPQWAPMIAMTAEDVPRVRAELVKICDWILTEFRKFAAQWEDGAQE